MPWGWSSARGRVLQGAWLGALTYVVPPGLADEAVGDGLAWEMRLRALPSRLGVYFVLGLCMHAGKPYREVLRDLADGVSGALAGAGWQVPAATALTRLRRRLGEKTFELLFGTPHGTDIVAVARGLGLRAATVELADELAAAFDEPGTTVVRIASNRRENVDIHAAQGVARR